MPQLNKDKKPSFLHAIFCFGGIILMICLGLLYFNINMHILLLLCLVWASINSILLKHHFLDIKNAMSHGIKKGLGAIYIFILIGIIIAAYIESGTIASTVYYSLELIHPAVFLPAGLLLCSIMSLAIGTSWGTVGTIGVILIGVGDAMGIPLPLVAGMVVSGASFGDKLSPVSDTTNLAAVTAGTDLYKHINSMLYTTVPTYIICIIFFTIMGLEYSTGTVPTQQIFDFQQAIESQFTISMWGFLPLIILFSLSLKKISAEPAMVASIISAIIIAMLLQDRNILDILNSLQEGYKIKTDHEGLNILLNRGGIQSMMWTLSLSLIALALGGILEGFGFLEALLKGILVKIKRAATLMLTTVLTGILSCLSMGETYIAIIVSNQLFKKKYEELHLQKYLLSRVVEESTTLITPLIPWTTTGAFYYGALGVPVLDYQAWALLNYLNPILSIILAYMGFGIFRLKQNEKIDKR